jgi:hypothetical protein
MQFKHLIIPAVLLFQAAGAQNGGAGITSSPATAITPAAAAASTPAPGATVTTESQPVTTPSPASPEGRTSYLDYKSIYETPTVEEEVKMATERFSLSPDQQDMWLKAATERRQGEAQARGILESKTATYEKDGAYRGLRTAQNTFHETVTGYLKPAQKQALETDRLIMQEKHRREAQLPPPPPPAPTITVAPVDSAAIKESEKGKGKSKKAKKKKKSAG